MSVILPLSDEKFNYLHFGNNSLAIRIPANEELLSLLLLTGPLLTSSANLTGETPLTNPIDIKKIFINSVDFFVDGGKITNNPSKVLRVVDDAIEIIRK